MSFRHYVILKANVIPTPCHSDTMSHVIMRTCNSDAMSFRHKLSIRAKIFLKSSFLQVQGGNKVMDTPTVSE